ncbi:hypothetical protein AAC387_Pa01g2050 [Persea americana]
MALHSPNRASYSNFTIRSPSSSTHQWNSCCSLLFSHGAFPKKYVEWVSAQCPRNQYSRFICIRENAIVPAPGKKTSLKKLTNGALPTTPMAECREVDKGDSTVSITVVGASGDLAKKKIYPALFALYYENCLPKHFTIFGYARSKMTDAELRKMVSKTLKCRINERGNCDGKMDEFLNRCFYQSGQYDSDDNFAELDKKLKEHEAGRFSNRLFYLSVPPNIFIDVYLVEDQIFRIDHYLGKELVENLSVLRFSNLIFQPLWSRQYIRNVQLNFSEDFGTEGRGGYFDSYGIIRDIMQNHLLQILALFAMESPVSLDAEDIRNEKVC